MGTSSQALLDLENKNPSSSKESALLVCKSDDFFPFKSATDSTNSMSQTKPTISSVPRSQVFGKLEDFLGAISESNKKLQLNSVDKTNDYNIEVLSGNESEYIEMDLMLGVADLHTPEAVAAAESAIAGNRVIPLTTTSNSEEESEDSSEDNSDFENMDVDEKNEDKDYTCSPTKVRRNPMGGESSGKVFRKFRSKKQQKIIELP